VGGGSATGGGTSTGGGNASGCAPLPAPTGHVVDVSDVPSLIAAVNGAQANDTIRLADGTYALNGQYVYLDKPGVTLRSLSGNREAVIIDGNYYLDPGGQGIGQILITIAADDVTVADLTVQRAYDHPIHVDASAGDVSNANIYNVHVIDPGQQGIKVNGDEPSFTHFADDGTIACSKIELTDQGRPNIRDSCYTGGIDVHAARGWTVRDNDVEGFWCTTGLSEHGIHFWKGVRDVVVERNRVRDCARGIGFGLGNTTPGRSYSDNPCNSLLNAGAYGGIIRNNFVSAQSAALFSSPTGFDSGIGLELACGTTVVHNSVASTMAPGSSGIEWRWQGTNITLTNNLTSAALKARDNGNATSAGNLANEPLTDFVDVASGDLHLAATASAPRNAGVAAFSVCSDDLDGEARSTTTPDVGADEVP